MIELHEFNGSAVDKVNKQGKITARNITEFFGPSLDKPRIKSVSTPSAPTTTLCDLGKDLEARVTAVLAAGDKLKQWDVKLYFIYVLQLEHSLRISEVINIFPSDIDSLGNVKIKGLKNSSSRIISSSVVRPYLLYCRVSGVFPFSEYNRFYVYRQYKKAGVVWQSGGESKSAVTHALRHIAAATARKENFDASLITQKLGHVSSKTQIHYGQTVRQTKKRQ